jgi:hypothetical protein
MSNAQSVHWALLGCTASARALTESGESRTRLKQLLDGTAVIPGITLRPLDRWNMVTTLVALNDPDAEKALAREKEIDHSTDG